jgi:hypothetical protein
MFVNKKLSKYIHVGFCFEGFIARNSVVQSEFNFDVRFTSYDFFNSCMLRARALMCMLAVLPARVGICAVQVGEKRSA